MNAKLKYTLAVAVLVVAILATAGITAGVMAAQQVTVNSPINVGYTANQVAATLSATYQKHGDAQATNFVTSSNATTISFDGTETTTDSANVKAFEAPANLTLSAEHKSITFEFSFVNNGDHDITATLTLPLTQKIVTITKTGNSNTFTVPTTATAQNPATYTVTVAVTEVARDAKFDGSFAWNLALAA